ncbi:MAG TPA: hypothetical protein VK909_10170 [Anaerolineales bacterium]|nr:hypothetical protein [Anaerolineales bacterium]
MSKFFVQMLLSVMVGISAALGLNPHVKSQLHDAWQEAGTYLHQTTSVAFKNASTLKTNVNAGIAVQAVSKSSTSSGEKIDLKLNSNMKVKNSNGNSLLGNSLPGFSLNNSATTQTQTSAGADTFGADVTLKEKTTSTLKLNLGSGN